MYKKDVELFLVKCKLNPDGVIQSKREIQSRLIKDDNDGITSIQNIYTIVSDYCITFDYFCPKKIGDNLKYQNNARWNKIKNNGE